MAEFSGGKEKLVRENEPIVFENKTDSSFDVSIGVIFHKSGMYEVSIVGNKTIVSKVTERKTGRWIYGEHDVAMCDGYYCSECGFFVPWDYKRKSIDFIKDYNFCPNCGSSMLKEGE